MRITTMKITHLRFQQTGLGYIQVFIRKLAVICVHVLILTCNAWGALGLQ